MRGQYQPNTTFSRRPGLPQLSSYAVFLLETLVYFVAIFPNYLQLSLKILTICSHTLTLILLVMFTLLTGCKDPSDSVLIRSYSKGWKESGDRQLYCDLCRSYVQENSRHCKVCNRCTEGFDHHCMWINNCIGVKNYGLFMCMIISAALHLSSFLIAICLLTTESHSESYKASFIISWVVGGIVFVFLLLVANLIILHLYLVYKGITTYEFIMAQREQEKLKEIQRKGSNEIDTKPHLPKVDFFNKEEQLSELTIKKEQAMLVKTKSIEIKQSKEVNANEVEKGSNEVIFGSKEPTQKSQETSQKGSKEAEPIIAEETKISQVFMRNKSLKLLLGNSEILYSTKSMRKQSEKKINQSK